MTLGAQATHDGSDDGSKNNITRKRQVVLTPKGPSVFLSLQNQKLRFSITLCKLRYDSIVFTYLVFPTVRSSKQLLALTSCKILTVGSLPFVRS